VKLSYVVATPEVVRRPASWPGWSVQTLERLAEIGYQGVELQVCDVSRFDRRQVVAQLRGVGLEAVGVSTGPMASDDHLFLSDPDESVRHQAIARLCSAVEWAGELGTHVAIGSIRGFASWSADRATALDLLDDGLGQVVAAASDAGVEVLIEPQSRQATDLCNTVGQTVALIERLGVPGLGMEADSFHMALEEASVPAALVEAQRSGFLRHVQVSDTNRLAPGWGHLNWSDFFATLRSLGYDGYVSVEANQIPDSEAAAVQGMRFVSAALAPSPLMDDAGPGRAHGGLASAGGEGVR
jgi:sugar phosphate isomerase/epimerase